MGKRVLFLPDQHLGRNTALKMGVPLDEMVCLEPPSGNMGGNTPEQLRRCEDGSVAGSLLRSHEIHSETDRAGAANGSRMSTCWCIPNA